MKFVAIFIGYDTIIFAQFLQKFEGYDQRHLKEYGQNYTSVHDLL